MLGCTIKSLPADVQLDAAKFACEINPANAVNMLGLAAFAAPEAGRLALLNSKYWGAKGVDLTVGFMEPTSAEMQARVVEHGMAWAKYCNVKLRLASLGNAMVRVTFAGDGYWSYLGPDILHVPPGEPTMCLSRFTMFTPESEWRRVVRHEFGHTYGFPHEHMRAAIIAQLDPEKTIAYFWRTQRWDRDTTISQVLRPLREGDLTSLGPPEPTSVMCYQLPAEITRTGQPVVGGTDITEGDGRLAAKVYPLAVQPPVNPPGPTGPPPEPPSGVLSLTADLGKKNLAIVTPAEWTGTVTKAKTVEETPDMAQYERAQLDAFAALAAQLEGAILPTGIPAAAAAAFGEGIGSVLKLIAALRELAAGKGDLKSTLVILRDVLNTVINLMGGPAVATGGGDGTVSFAEVQHGLDWSVVIDVVGQLLPLLLKLRRKS